MQVAIPHQLGREEARNRLRANSHKMADSFPGRMANVQTSWPTEDRMAMAIQAMGQSVTGHIDVQDSQVIDGTAIVYRVGGRLYVNRPEIGADSLDNDDILVTRTTTDQLCRIDTVRLIDRTSRIPRGFVGLGDFVPYTKPSAH